jgi:hypothetical protein
MRSFAVCAAIVSLLFVSAVRAGDGIRPDLAVGQVWSIKGDPTSKARIIVGRIEPFGTQLVAVCVSIVDFPTDEGPVSIGHAPFEKAVLVSSLDRLLATGSPLPATFEDGYAQWKSAQGGVFTIRPADAVAVTLAMLKRRR